MSLIERLRARAEWQRRKRGDMLYRGDADPELEEAATQLEAMERWNEALADRRAWHEEQVKNTDLSLYARAGHAERMDEIDALKASLHSQESAK